MIVAADFETFYSSDYSLRKMRMVDYLRDPRFEAIMCAVQEGGGPNEAFMGAGAIKDRLARIDWSKTAMLSHNTRFDGAVARWHFGFTPALYLDTLSMARAMTHAVIGKSSLAAVADYLGLGAKGAEVVHAQGKRLRDFAPHELDAYAGYCLNDNALCRQIFDTFMAHGFPKRELRVIDLVIRMYTEPQARLDRRRLRAHRTVVRVEKCEIMARVGHIDPAVFSSNARFSVLLQTLGVDVPMKDSPTTGMPMPALARNDREFKELCADDTQPPEVQAVLAARIGAKSTIEETRTDALLNLSLREWGELGSAWMPVPLKYYGAHTGRLSGDEGYNFQNLKRTSPLRRAIEAPPGMRVVHRDASQIEARMLAWLAGCERLLAAFREGRDVYSEFATEVYGRPITKRDKLERFVGKTCILGLGYQTGGPKLRHTLFIGNGGISVPIDEHEAVRIVRRYRSAYSEIPLLWARGEFLLALMLGESGHAAGQALQRLTPAWPLDDMAPYPVVEHTAEAVWLPNGMPIAYPGLKREARTLAGNTIIKGFAYKGPYKTKQIYGGKLTENVTQALARIVVMDIAVRVQAETGYHPFLSTHDSLDYVVPEEEASWWDGYLDREFARRPAWAPDLPLASEGGWGRTLADAEHGANR